MSLLNIVVGSSVEALPSPEEHFALIPLWTYYGKDKWIWETVTKTKVILMMAKSNTGSLVLSAISLVGSYSMYVLCMSEWEQLCIPVQKLMAVHLLFFSFSVISSEARKKKTPCLIYHSYSYYCNTVKSKQMFARIQIWQEKDPVPLEIIKILYLGLKM